MLQIRNLSKVYETRGGAVRALDSVSLHVTAGEFVAVRGPSGSGKTTLLLAAGGLLEPDEGEVIADGQDLYALSSEHRARFRAASIGFVFQQFHLIPYLSVLDNVLTPCIAHHRPDARDRAEELIRRLGLGDRIRHVPAELSTGERQRAALARALLNEPSVLLADEPTGNLDEENADTVLGYLAQFSQSGGAVLLVTHSADAAGRAQRVVQLNNGKVDQP